MILGHRWRRDRAMKPAPLLLPLMFMLASGANGANGATPQIVASNLYALDMPGKVNGVLWTRRTDFYSLQILVPAQGKSEPPRIEAWLQRADGSRIDATGRW